MLATSGVNFGQDRVLYPLLRWKGSTFLRCLCFQLPHGAWRCLGACVSCWLTEQLAESTSARLILCRGNLEHTYAEECLNAFLQFSWTSSAAASMSVVLLLAWKVTEMQCAATSMILCCICLWCVCMIILYMQGYVYILYCTMRTSTKTHMCVYVCGCVQFMSDSWVGSQAAYPRTLCLGVCLMVCKPHIHGHFGLWHFV